MKVTLLDSQIISGYDYSLEQKIVEEAGYTFVKETCKNEDEVIERCSDADIILNITIRMTEKSIGKLSNCKGMIRYGIGVDEFDMEAATKRGIKVCNVSTYCIPEVALHATALLLAGLRQLKHFDRAVGRGVWNQDLGRPMRRASEQVIGLLGFGNIARTIAKNLKGIGYQIAAYDPYVPAEVFAECGVEKTGLYDLFAKADALSLHLPQTEETYQMLNKDTFAKMKDGVVIVNAARGGLINEKDLIDALNTGKVGAAGLDVMDSEPMKDTDHPLLHMDQVILTPHIAYRSQEANRELFCQVAETAVSILRGETPPNVLNKKALGL